MVAADLATRMVERVPVPPGQGDNGSAMQSTVVYRHDPQRLGAALAMLLGVTARRRRAERTGTAHAGAAWEAHAGRRPRPRRRWPARRGRFRAAPGRRRSPGARRPLRPAIPRASPGVREAIRTASARVHPARATMLRTRSQVRAVLLAKPVLSGVRATPPSTMAGRAVGGPEGVTPVRHPGPAHGVGDQQQAPRALGPGGDGEQGRRQVVAVRDHLCGQAVRGQGRLQQAGDAPGALLGDGAHGAVEVGGVGEAGVERREDLRLGGVGVAGGRRRRPAGGGRRSRSRAPAPPGPGSSSAPVRGGRPAGGGTPRRGGTHLAGEVAAVPGRGEVRALRGARPGWRRRRSLPRSTRARRRRAPGGEQLVERGGGGGGQQGGRAPAWRGSGRRCAPPRGWRP